MGSNWLDPDETSGETINRRRHSFYDGQPVNKWLQLSDFAKRGNKNSRQSFKNALQTVSESPTKDVSEVLIFAESSPAPLSASLFFDDSDFVVLIEEQMDLEY